MDRLIHRVHKKVSQRLFKLLLKKLLTIHLIWRIITNCAGGRHNMPRPCKLTFDLLTLKLMSESRVTWATSVPILVFLGLSVLDLGLMYATDSQTSDSQTRIIA